MPTVTLEDLEEKFVARRSKAPHESPDVSYQAACDALGLGKDAAIRAMKQKFIERRVLGLIERWQRPRRPVVDRKEMQLPVGDRNDAA